MKRAYEKIELIEIDKSTDVAVLKPPEISGREDMHTLGVELYSLAEVEEKTRIVIDFRDFKILSAPVYVKLMKLFEKLDERNGKLSLCSLHSHDRQAMQETKLDQDIACFDTRQEALDS